MQMVRKSSIARLLALLVVACLSLTSASAFARVTAPDEVQATFKVLAF